jgi:hypothetical protein
VTSRVPGTIRPRRPSLVRFHHRARTGLTTAGCGAPYRAASRQLGTFIVINIYYRHFTIYAGGGSPAEAGAIIPRREDFTMASHSTPDSRSAAVDDVAPEELHPRKHHSGFEAYQS